MIKYTHTGECLTADIMKGDYIMDQITAFLEGIDFEAIIATITDLLAQIDFQAILDEIMAMVSGLIG